MGMTRDWTGPLQVVGPVFIRAQASQLRLRNTAVIAFATATYLLVYVIFEPLQDGAIAILSVAPVMVASLLLGLLGGLAVAILMLPVNSLLTILVSHTGWQDWLASGGALGSASLVLVALVLGSMRDAMAEATRNNARLKQFKGELRESEERSRKIFEYSNDAIFLVDPARDEILDVNPVACTMLGYTREELLALPMADIHPLEMTRLQAFARTVYEAGHGWTDELTCTTKGGEALPVEISASTFEQDGRPLMIAIVRDISQRKADEAALRLTQLAVDRAAEAVFWIRPDGSFAYANDAACYSLGYSKEELLSLSVHDINPGMTREAWPRFWEKIKQSGTFIDEYVHQAKDGRVYPVEISANYVRFGDSEYNFAFVRDITERKLLQEELIQAQKMEVVGQLAGGVAHDFNNLLSIILGFSELAKQAVADNESAVDCLEQVQSAGHRAATLTNQLLAFSRQQVTQPAVINLNELVFETDRMLRCLIGENIELVGLFAPEPMDILIDPGQMEQVLVNMVVNARDAMPDGGKLTIETAIVTLDEASARRLADLAPGEYVRLSVTDTGIGMDAEVRAHLFEPFFTTKGPDKGTGLGLATCYGIITQAEGAILVRSEPGQGSTFDIYLPKAEAENVAEAEVGDSEELLSGTETVLLVEDEPSVRRLGIAVLERQGYNVLEAANGEDALSIAEEYGGQRIQLLLTDLVMPQMGGRALAGRLHDQFPGIRVLFTSGFPDEGATPGDVSDTSVSFLPKPFTPGSLARQVRQVLDAGVPA